MNLIDELRSRTRQLHCEAERSGIIRELLRGATCPLAYAMYLRCLLPVYQQLERTLSRPDLKARFGTLADPAVYRSEAILADLPRIAGADWQEILPELPACIEYSERIDWIATNEPAALLGHVYTRYLGDLNGGQILQRVLSRTLRLPADALNFYRFPAIVDLPEFRSAYLALIMNFALDRKDVLPIAKEAVASFKYNIRLSEQVLMESIRQSLPGQPLLIR